MTYLSVLKHTSYHMLADDVQLYLNIPVSVIWLLAPGVLMRTSIMYPVGQLNAKKSQGIL